MPKKTDIAKTSEIAAIEPMQVQQMIHIIRGERVILDRDLAQLYGVETKNLKRQVKRNIARFPSDFMIELTREEYNSLRCQNGTIETGRGEHSKYLPYAFTENGKKFIVNGQLFILREGRIYNAQGALVK